MVSLPRYFEHLNSGKRFGSCYFKTFLQYSYTHVTSFIVVKYRFILENFCDRHLYDMANFIIGSSNIYRHFDLARKQVSKSSDLRKRRYDQISSS